jgi:polar amino acid transport system permease protein
MTFLSAMPELTKYINTLPYLLEGTVKALLLFGLTLALAVPLGLLVARAGQARSRLVTAPVRLYLLIMRGTPLLLQLIFFMYFPPFVLNFPIDRFLAAVIAFSLNYAAYFAEIFRGGIEAIPKGQLEAAHVLGFSSWQTFMRITLPQVVKRILPACGNECMTLVKDTALAQVIGVAELFRAAQNTTSRLVSIVPIVIAGGIYLLLNSVVSYVFSRSEKHLNYYRN